MMLPLFKLRYSHFQNRPLGSKQASTGNDREIRHSLFRRDRAPASTKLDHRRAVLPTKTAAGFVWIMKEAAN